MKRNTQEKSLVQVNENVFYKIKRFFKNLFNKNNDIIDNYTVVENENKKNSFMKSIKNIEDEENLILKLQKKYRSGEIKEENLTEEQVNSLCALYDRQIANLKKSNEIRKQKLLEYRRKLRTDN